MDSCFCCLQIQPYRPQRLDHEDKFTTFVDWARQPQDAASTATDESDAETLQAAYAVQLVKQVNHGPLESKRYFVPVSAGGFKEIKEDDIIQANFQKLNSFKNFKCNSHNKFFEVNLYQPDPVNKHHWRSNVARPASEIDL